MSQCEEHPLFLHTHYTHKWSRVRLRRPPFISQRAVGKCLTLLRFIAYNDYSRRITLLDIIYHQYMSKGLACKNLASRVNTCHVTGWSVYFGRASCSSVVSHVARWGGWKQARGNLDACLTFPLNHNQARVTRTHTGLFFSPGRHSLQTLK